MPTHSERLEFAPPPTPGLVRAMLLAILAHGLLLAVLAVGVQWKREATPVTVEAELWSSVPQEAAPPAPEETTPPPEPPKPPQPTPEVKPTPVAPTPPAPPKVDIALEKEKARQLKEKQLQQEKAEQEKQKLARLQQEKLQKEKAEKEKQDKLARDKKLQEQSAQKVDKAKALAEAKKLEELRQQNLKRMAGLAGGPVGNGEASSTGSAAQSSAPSAAYSGRVAARIKPNITYIETIVGNPTTEIEVRTSPDGTILGRKVVKPSGTKSWDEAALNAIDKTAVLPRDENGRVPSSLIIILSPQVLLGR